MIENLLILSCIVAGWSLLLIIWNCFLYKQPAQSKKHINQNVSVLIPARNEQDNIAAVLDSILANEDVQMEIIVLDDGSTDNTSKIVRQYQAKNSQISLRQSPGLPAGWVGKEHACHLLSEYASHSFLLFLDADVRLKPNAISRLVEEMEIQQLDFLSGFPKLITVSFAEKLIIPMIDFILLGFLPLIGLKKTHIPAFAAANGQLILVRKLVYKQVGGHQVNALKMHDGLALARNFKKHKRSISICNAREIAESRMYHNFTEIWKGFLKNATEGMATKKGLPIWTFILFIGHLIAYVLLPYLYYVNSELLPWVLLAIFLSLSQRLIVLIFLRQPVYLTVFHPLAVIVMLAIQWRAYIRAIRGVPNQWRGRHYQAKI